jgi:hypothetical protein
MKTLNRFSEKKKRRAGSDWARQLSAGPAQIQREGRHGGSIWTYQRVHAVSGPGRPNRYRASSVVRSSDDRRRSIVIYAGTERGGGNPRVSPGSCGGSPWACWSAGIEWRRLRGLLVVVSRHRWSRRASGDGVVEEILHVLRLGSAAATCSTGPSQNEERG